MMMRATTRIGLVAGIAILGALGAAADVAAGKRAYDRGDFQTAFQEWEVSAKQGDSEAQYRVGMLYRDGRGVERDMLEFVHWWSQAARQGNREAQKFVGWPIGRDDAPYLTSAPRRPRFDSLELIDCDIELHNTRPLVEQMVLAQADNYTPGSEPERPNVEVLVYRVDGGQRSLVLARVSLMGGSNSGPYGDDARRGHFRNSGLFNETLSISLRIPVEEAERRIYGAQMLSETEKLVQEGKANPALLELNRKLLKDGWRANPYFDSILPNRTGHYEMVVRYASRDERFWPGQLTSPAVRFEVVKTKEWIDVLRGAKPR